MGAIISPVLRNTSNMIFLIIPYSICRCHIYSQEMCQDNSSFFVLMGWRSHPINTKKDEFQKLAKRGRQQYKEGSPTISGQQAGQKTGENAALVRSADNEDVASMQFQDHFDNSKPESLDTGRMSH